MNYITSTVTPGGRRGVKRNADSENSCESSPCIEQRPSKQPRMSTSSPLLKVDNTKRMLTRSIARRFGGIESLFHQRHMRFIEASVRDAIKSRSASFLIEHRASQLSAKRLREIFDELVDQSYGIALTAGKYYAHRGEDSIALAYYKEHLSRSLAVTDIYVSHAHDFMESGNQELAYGLYEMFLGTNFACDVLSAFEAAYSFWGVDKEKALKYLNRVYCRGGEWPDIDMFFDHISEYVDDLDTVADIAERMEVSTGKDAYFRLRYLINHGRANKAVKLAQLDLAHCFHEEDNVALLDGIRYKIKMAIILNQEEAFRFLVDRVLKKTSSEVAAEFFDEYMGGWPTPVNLFNYTSFGERKVSDERLRALMSRVRISDEYFTVDDVESGAFEEPWDEVFAKTENAFRSLYDHKDTIVQDVMQEITRIAQNDIRFAIHIYSDLEREFNDGEDDGFYDHQYNRVVVCMSADSESFVPILLHELGHAFIQKVFLNDELPYPKGDNDILWEFARVRSEVISSLSKHYNVKTPSFEKAKKLFLDISKGYSKSDYSGEFISRFLEIVFLELDKQDECVAEVVAPLRRYWDEYIRPQLKLFRFS